MQEDRGAERAGERGGHCVRAGEIELGGGEAEHPAFRCEMRVVLFLHQILDEREKLHRIDLALD